MADSNWSESTSTSGCDHSDFEASMKGENNDRAFKPICKIRPCDLSHQHEPKIEQESRSNIFLLEILKIVYVSWKL